VTSPCLSGTSSDPRQANNRVSEYEKFIPAGSQFMHYPTSYRYSPIRTRKHPSYLRLKNKHNPIRVYTLVLHPHTKKKTRSPLVFCYPLSLGTIQTQGTPVFATSINSFHSLSPFHTSSKSKYSSLISLISDRKKNTSCRASSCRTAALLL
jgi:hypothetical protein